MNDKDKEIIEQLCYELDKMTKRYGIRLEVIEIKETLYIFPKLPPPDKEVQHE